MKKTEFPINNAGGLRRIIAIPESSFLSVGYASDGSRTLNLSDTDDIICIECLPSDASTQENRKESDSGETYQIEISGMIYGKTLTNDEIILLLDVGTWIVAHEDADGNWVVSGANRVRLVFERKKDTASSFSGLKGTLFSFSCMDEYPGININKPLL